MADQPKILLKKDKKDKLVELTAWLILLSLVAFTWFSYQALTETVAIHFDIHGHADAFGNKKHVWFVLAIPTLLTCLLFWINQYPHLFNYPVKITPENAFSQYRKATKLIRWMAVSLNLVFTFIQFNVVTSATQANIQAPWLIYTVVISVPFIPLLVYFIVSLKNKT